jgi:excisionase family DNA binding protein
MNESSQSEFWNENDDDETATVAPPPSTKVPSVIEAASDDETFLTSAQAAKLLNLSQKGLRGMASKGKIPYYKLGREFRYKRSELIKMMVPVTPIVVLP